LRNETRATEIFSDSVFDRGWEAAESAEFFRAILMQLNPWTAGKIAHQNGRRVLAESKRS